MSIFSKFGSWVKEKAAPIAKVALPLAAFAVGMVAPGAGAAIGKLADKIGNKVADITGIGDDKPGVFGIGDGLPGVFGIGTGKNAAKSRAEQNNEIIAAIEAKLKLGQSVPPDQLAAYEAAKKDMGSAGINPMYLVGGALLALFALRK